MNFTKPLLSVFFSLTLLLPSPAQEVEEDYLDIAIITFGPYQGELYSAFGHSGIRVIDRKMETDIIYHYGQFNFDQENFYWNFARGYMRYSIGRGSYARFIRHYVGEDRLIREQYLNFTLSEKEVFNNFLQTNYLPENREYLYNYVYDNCATKIRDVIEKAVPKKVQLDLSYKEEGVTIRDLMDRYLGLQPWGDWIIDVGLGSQIDKAASAEEYMFLPDYIYKALDGGTISRDHTSVPLVEKTLVIHTPEKEEPEASRFTPFNTFVVLFFIVGFFTNRDFKTRKRSHWVDVTLFTFVGILGWWCSFLWLGTVHLSKANFNLLWAIPFHIPLVYLLKLKSLKQWVSRYFLTIGILHIGVILAWGLLPQPLHMALIPLILAVTLRCFYIYYDINSVSNNQ